MDAGLMRESVEVDVAARLFQALSDPTRLAILLCLLAGERRVSDIVDAVGSSQPNVSNHLACLKGCGLVVDRPGERRQVFYSIARPEVAALLTAAEGFLAENGQAVELCASPLMPRRRGRRG
jgi:ArsR family transcriptional regulator, cadmium/lead-responsive transcriptional repressor